MLSERLKKRLDKDRPMTSITLRIPIDVVESMKEIASPQGIYRISANLRLNTSNYVGTLIQFI
jgi:predicted DNA binding CopG/RHH family protein